MKVTVITIVRNDRQNIQRTIVSVLAQSHPDIEYIVLDGASSDGTQEIIESYAGHIDHYISEPDAGISDAWNKGIARAGGDVIALLNCADEYYPDTVERAVEALGRGADLIYGDTDMTDQEGHVSRRTRGRFSRWRYGGGLGFWHPSVFCRADLYERTGEFSPAYKYAMDNDWMLRALRLGARFRRSTHRVKMQTGGVSVRNRYLAYGEHLTAMGSNGVPPHLIHANMVMTGARWMARGALQTLNSGGREVDDLRQAQR